MVARVGDRRLDAIGVEQDALGARDSDHFVHRFSNHRGDNVLTVFELAAR